MEKKIIWITSAVALLMMGYSTPEKVQAQSIVSSQQQIESPYNDELEKKAQSKNPLGDDILLVEDALKQFQSKFNKTPTLPKFIPFQPTHSGAFFRDWDNQLRVDYLDNNSKELLSIVIVMENFDYKQHSVSIVLEDKTKAQYKNNPKSGFESLKFQKDNLTYQIVISKSKEKRSNKMNELIQIANSF